jgi:DUF4097 and DUF4098 domain-containing protein YvlB
MDKNVFRFLNRQTGNRMNKEIDQKPGTTAFCTLAFLLGSALASLHAATTESNLEKTFPVKPGGQLVIEADRGPIEVTTSDRADMVVEVRRKISSGSAQKAAEVLEAHIVTFEQDGDRIFVRARVKDEARRLFDRGAQNFQVEYRVQAPKQFNYDLRTAAGNISSGDIDGTVKARTSGGSLRFAAISGTLEANTSAGSIRAGTIGGVVAATTAGGNIQIDELAAGGKANTSAGSITVSRSKTKLLATTAGGSILVGEFDGSANLSTSAGSIEVKSARGPLTAATSGGNITIEDAQDTVSAETSAGGISATFSAQPSGDCKLRTSGGSVTVKLDPELAFDVDAKTSGGKVTTEMPVAMVVMGEARNEGIKGKINGGGKALVLRTSAGSIAIRKK